MRKDLLYGILSSLYESSIYVWNSVISSLYESFIKMLELTCSLFNTVTQCPELWHVGYISTLVYNFGFCVTKKVYFVDSIYLDFHEEVFDLFLLPFHNSTTWPLLSTNTIKLTLQN